MNSSRRIAKSIVMTFAVWLGACNGTPGSISDNSQSSTFVLDPIRIVGAEAISEKLNPTWQFPSFKIFRFKARIRDAALLEEIVGTEYSIRWKLPEGLSALDAPSTVIARTTTEGDLHWSLPASFDYLAAECYFVIPFQVTSVENPADTTRVEFALNPWGAMGSGGAEGLDLRYQAPGVTCPSKGERATISLNRYEKTFLGHSENVLDEFMNLTIYKDYQIRLDPKLFFNSTLSGKKREESLTHGRFRIKMLVYTEKGPDDDHGPFLLASSESVESIENGVLRTRLRMPMTFKAVPYMRSRNQILVEIAPEDPSIGLALFRATAPFEATQRSGVFDAVSDVAKKAPPIALRPLEDQVNQSLIAIQAKSAAKVTPLEFFRLHYGFDRLSNRTELLSVIREHSGSELAKAIRDKKRSEIQNIARDYCLFFNQSTSLMMSAKDEEAALKRSITTHRRLAAHLRPLLTKLRSVLDGGEFYRNFRDALRNVNGGSEPFYGARGLFYDWSNQSFARRYSLRSMIELIRRLESEVRFSTQADQLVAALRSSISSGNTSSLRYYDQQIRLLSEMAAEVRELNARVSFGSGRSARESFESVLRCWEDPSSALRFEPTRHVESIASGPFKHEYDVIELQARWSFFREHNVGRRSSRGTNTHQTGSANVGLSISPKVYGVGFNAGAGWSWNKQWFQVEETNEINDTRTRVQFQDLKNLDGERISFEFQARYRDCLVIQPKGIATGFHLCDSGTPTPVTMVEHWYYLQQRLAQRDPTLGDLGAQSDRPLLKLVRGFRHFEELKAAFSKRVLKIQLNAHQPEGAAATLLGYEANESQKSLPVAADGFFPGQLEVFMVD